MKSARLALSLLIISALCGCGFHSVYGTRSDDEGRSVETALNNISIENIPDRDGQILRNDLVDRMYGKGRPTQPLYSLKVKIHSSVEDLGILADATATRELLNMYGDFTLDDAHGNVLLTGTSHSVTGYDRLDQMYGTVAAQASAHERTLHEISEQITNRISLYFSEKK